MEAVQVQVIDRFRRPYGFLSNMSKCEVEYDGVLFSSVETAFQYAKCALESDKEKIKRYGVRPDMAKRISHSVQVREDWKDVRISIMHDLLKQKFGAEKLKKKLLGTGSAILIEGNEHFDYFWGKCHGVGLNNLGKLLMEIRDELIEGSEEAA